MQPRKYYLEYLMFKKKWHVISSMLDVPILIVLFYLKYFVGFWILLALFLLSEVQYSRDMRNLSNSAGIGENW